jgi:hypothetical protein
MLEDIVATPYQGSVFRYVNREQHIELLRKLGFDPQGISEIVALLQECGITDDPSDVLDGPFAYKPLLKSERTRFSDGTVRVFYSALEPETAKREQQHWHMKPLLQGGEAPLRMYYRCVQCTFSGDVKDLRPMVGKWPFLVDDDGYDQCNQLGVEAARSGLGGLLSRSARRPEGTTSPIFSRPCLSDVEFQAYSMFEYDPSTKAVTVSVL